MPPFFNRFFNKRSLIGSLLAVTVLLAVAALAFAQQDDPLPLPDGEAALSLNQPRAAELIINGGFELAGATSGEAASWKLKNPLNGDKRICNRVNRPSKPDKIVAHSESCAFQFKIDVTNVNRSIIQKNSTPFGSAGENLSYGFWVQAKNFSGEAKMQVKAKYGDGTKDKSVAAVGQGTYAYTAVGNAFTLDAVVTKLVVKIASSGQGRLWIDDVSAITIPVGAPTPTPTGSATSTDVGTATAVDTATASATSTPIFTFTPSDTPTITPSPTASDTPTITSSPTVTDTPTNTATDTATDMPTDTPTDTPTNTPSDTPTDTPTTTPTSTPTPIPTAVVVNDSYDVAPNIGIVVDAANGILSNDTLNGGTITAPTLNTDVATTLGGTINLQADGSFTYDPPPGLINTVDSIQYTVTNGGGPANGTISFTILNQPAVWFIDNTAAAGGTGLINDPFESIDAYMVNQPNTTAGDIIYLHTGTGTYDGAGLTLKNTQEVRGNGFDLSTRVTWLPAFSLALPTMGARPLLTSTGAGVTVAQDNILTDFNIGNTAAASFDITGAAVGELAIIRMALSGTGGALNISTSGLPAIIFDSTNVTSATNAVNIIGAGGSVNFGGGAMTSTGNVFVVNGGSVSITFTGTLAQASNAALVEVSNHAIPGTITLTSAAATDGSGILFSNADGSYTLGTVTLNGGNARFRINNGSNGTINVTNGTITNPTGDAFTIAASTPKGTFGTTGAVITKNSAGYALDVNDLQSGGSYTVNATITASNASAGARFIDSEGDLTVTTLSLGTSGARFTTTPLTITNNSGDLTLTTYNVYTSTTAGLVSTSPVTGFALGISNGIVDATGSTAINISHGSIFQLLSVQLTTVTANNSTRGINLQRTTGNFNITGDGGANSTSGGTISSMTESGVRLDNAANVSLQRMTFNNASTTSGANCVVNDLINCNAVIIVTNSIGLSLNRVNINGAVDHAIYGYGVNGLTLTNSIIENIGNADGKSALSFERFAASGANLSGTVTITDTIIRNVAKHMIAVENFAGAAALTLNISNSTLQNNRTGTQCGGFDCGGHGIFLRADGNGVQITLNANTVQFNEITGNGVDGAAEGGTATLTANVIGSTFTPVTYVLGSVQNGNSGIQLATTQASTLRFDLTGNTINQSGSHGITIGGIGNGGLIEGKIVSNTVDFSGTGNGIAVRIGAQNSSESYTARVKIQGNTVSNTRLTNISAFNRDGSPSGVLDVALLNNTVTQGNSITGLGVELRAQDDTQICAVVTGNTVTVGTTAKISVRETIAAVFKLQGVSPSPANETQIDTYLKGANTISTTLVQTVDGVFETQNCASDTLP
jgi:hypothetical protein